MRAEAANFEVTRQARGSAARCGVFCVSGQSLATPALWLGHRVGGMPRPWQAFDLPGLLMNACDIISTGRTLSKARDSGLNDYLGLPRSTPVLLDSGGYLYLKRERMDADPVEVLHLYEDLGPSIGVVLDHPLDPLAEADVNRARWEHTLANTRAMLERNGRLTLMPTVHAHSVAQAKAACAELRSVVDEPVAVGVGSLVPLMRGRRARGMLPSGEGRAGSSDAGGHQSSRHLAVEIIKTVRAEFPRSFLHVFGVGGTTTMHLMFALGVDSLDSIGWRLKAGYGAVQLPGLGDRLTGARPRGGRTLLMLDDDAKSLLCECQCPVCRGRKTFEARLDALASSFNNRAMHNAWVFVQEAAEFRERVRTGGVEQFTCDRLRSSALRSLLPCVFPS